MEDQNRCFEVLAAIPAHIEAIAQLHLNTIACLANLAPQGFGQGIRRIPPIAEIRAEFEDALEAADLKLLVATLDGDFAGFVLGVIEKYGDELIDSPYLTVQYLEVEPKFKRSGAGEMLMGELQNLANSLGCTAVELIVWQNNQPVRSLFQKLGFSPLEVRMAKKLEP